MEITDYEREFVERTQAILQNYGGEYQLTNAINCMLGLIILPNEMLKRSQSPKWGLPIAEIQELNFLRIRQFKPIRGKRNGVTEYFPKTLKVFLKKVRNGLAHQNIKPINMNGFFTGIEIKNYHRNIVDLEVEFSRQELEQFALFIAGEYLVG
jgi:hypothetical protein